jgi:hypothetical protein
MRERIDHAKIRAVVQVIIDKDKGVDVFEEYMKTAFPWIANATKREKDHFIKMLRDEIQRTNGLLKVTQSPDNRKQVRSRLNERIQQAAPKPSGPVRDTGALYSRMTQKDRLRR